MFKKIIAKITKLFWYLLLAGMGILTISRIVTGLVGWVRTYGESDVPTRPVAIVFGAGLTRSGGATAVLRDRIQTAANLYFSGKVEKLLMSGDNSTVEYNEPAAMREFALSLGIPDEAIVLDYAGRRTYDTCYRARAIFGVDSAILVTQPFHMPRAVYLCNALGVDGVGVVAENFNYRRSSLLFWNARELAATVTALIDVHITRPLPILGEPEPIFKETVLQ
jgi:vancomycin permeability regulator SanA